MQLKKFLIIAFSFQLLAFSFVSAAWYGPSSPPSFRGIFPPINTSNTEQIIKGSDGKSPSFGVKGILSADKIFATSKLGVGPNPPPTGLWGSEIDRTAVLDVNGQIRIQGNCSAGDCGGKVLTASTTNNGLAVWKNPLNNFTDFNINYAYPVPIGIILTDITNSNIPVNGCTPGITEICQIEVATTTIQTQITSTCTNGAISEVRQDGTVSCQRLVSSITLSPTNSGLTNNSTVGTPVLSINPGAGLELSGNVFQVKPPAIGSGLVISNNYLKFATTSPALLTACSGNNVYWRYYDDGTWDCSPSLTPGLRPGNSIMYVRSSTAVSPPVCPTGSGWTDLLGNYYTETVSNAGYANNVRICKRSVPTNICQVMYLTNSSGLVGCSYVSIPKPPACPLADGWFDTATTSPNPVYTPNAGNYCNEIRTCYRCN